MMNKKFIYGILFILLIILAPLFLLSCSVTDSVTETPVAETVSHEMEENSPLVAESPSPSPSVTPVQKKYSPPPAPVIPEPVEVEEEPIVVEPEPEKAPIEAWPVWMYIPAIGLDAEIQDTGRDTEIDSMAIVPSGSIISWWRESSIPGNEGNAILGGHNKWNGQYGQLYALDTMDIGDVMVIVYDDETRVVFRLESVFVYALATAPANVIMDLHGDARVTIITCKEPFNPVTGTSDNRIIAIFKEESVFVIPDPPIEPFPPQER